MPTEDEQYELELLHGEIVEAPGAGLEPAMGERLPSRVSAVGVQTAVAAATGFVAGAATMALLRRYAHTRLDRAAAPAAIEPPRPGPVRTYVVHVRQLG
ncbi:MAG TPA: hypothetical protein VFN65_10060 [Solirubrobacteraceae bacterium]|nr:hypothetical protein [Solirubrobacteraceae bacterium]